MDADGGQDRKDKAGSVAAAAKVTSKTVWLDHAQVVKGRHLYRFSRRAQDIFFSLLALVVLAVPMLLVAAAIWIDSPGASPVFQQERVGRDGKVFKLYKFRTMVPHAEEKLNEVLRLNEMDSPVFKIKNDPRITRVGRFLRKTGIDELPQLLNILELVFIKSK